MVRRISDRPTMTSRNSGSALDSLVETSRLSAVFPVTSMRPRLVGDLGTLIAKGRGEPTKSRTGTMHLA